MSMYVIRQKHADLYLGQNPYGWRSKEKDGRMPGDLVKFKTREEAQVLAKEFRGCVVAEEE